MSGAASGAQEFLAAFKTLMVTQIPLSVTAVAAGGGSALATAPVKYEIRDDLDDIRDLPHCAIWAEDTQVEHKISPFDDHVISLRMAITCRAAGSTAATAFDLPQWYCQVLRNAFDEVLPNGVAGAYWAAVDRLYQERVEGNDKWRRRAMLEATVRYRTARET